MACELARDGVVLVLLGRDRMALEETARRCSQKGATCRIALCDLSDSSAVRALGAELAADGLHPELIVANAGILHGRKEGEKVEAGDCAGELLQVNLIGAVTLVSLFLPHLMAKRRGHVLFVSSLAALSPLADAAAYSASKAGLLSYGLALREALAGSGVLVQVACPGYISTSIARRHIGARPGQLTAVQGARALIKGMRRGRAFFGFPFTLFKLARLSLLMPERLRRLVTVRLRFHVRPTE